MIDMDQFMYNFKKECEWKMVLRAFCLSKHNLVYHVLLRRYLSPDVLTLVIGSFFVLYLLIDRLFVAHEK
jgi:hypothetical protein